ncbi:HlyD family type I secretion periplasmic adaptor subunit [Sphingomonas sp. LHG3406-1]|uniref:HlyD family type I secretion periplasmic adaptor subunit n=1 Tax=Sphingomonas sp. LHG3406-1 TaxID=2804617 RepID=UPI00262B10FF|nr:HlyD family type I secretion periplasmic adaptor subunit [Sphingomonas sp. LHG3406-1]
MNMLQTFGRGGLPANPGGLSVAGETHPADASPEPDIRRGLIIAFLFFVVLLGWAAFARLDAAATAGGKLAVSGQRQTIQHREGGVVSDIGVREGQKVQQGEVLLRLAGADVRAQERSLAAQTISLLAQRARLQAEQAGTRVIVPPSEFTPLTGDDRRDAEQALRLQASQLNTRLAVLSAQRGVLGQRASQASSSGQGYSRQVAAIDEQLRLINEELSSLQTVAEQGFVSKSRLRALERSRAELQGQRGQYTATVAQSGSQVGESRLQALEAQRDYDQRVADELRDVETKLGDLLPRWNAARDQLARTELRAPVSGTVVGLSVFTRGGVIAPGEKLMDIVPDQAPLTIEARVSPNDADDVRAGQRAFVRFDSLHERSLPPLEGEVRRISADAFTDERTGESFFTAEVFVPVSELRKIDQTGGSHVLRAGLPVNVEIPIRKRTALQYIFEPLTGAFRRSLTEH